MNDMPLRLPRPSRSGLPDRSTPTAASAARTGPLGDARAEHGRLDGPTLLELIEPDDVALVRDELEAALAGAPRRAFDAARRR